MKKKCKFAEVNCTDFSHRERKIVCSLMRYRQLGKYCFALKTYSSLFGSAVSGCKILVAQNLTKLLLRIYTRCSMLRVCLPHEYGSSVYLTNMDRPSLSTTPTRSLICYAAFSQTKPPRRVDCLVLLGEFRLEVYFSRHQRYIAQFRNRTKPKNLWLPICTLIH